MISSIPGLQAQDEEQLFGMTKLWFAWFAEEQIHVHLFRPGVPESSSATE